MGAEKRETRENDTRSLQGQLVRIYSHLITHAIYIYNYLRRRNETTGRKRQSTTVSTRKPRRNDTRASANWALEVTPSRGMLFHPRSMPRPASHSLLTFYQPPALLPTSFYLLIILLPLSAPRIDAVDEKDFEDDFEKERTNVKNIIISYTFSRKF